MNSDKVKAGVEHAPHRSLLKADGYNDEQMRRPFIGVVNSFNEVAPGHMHLQTIARAVKDGVLAAGGTPMEFNTIGVCDGIAMGHDGMHFSLSSRELIADTIECMVKAHCFDALEFIPNCEDRSGYVNGSNASEPSVYLRVRWSDALHQPERLKYCI